MSGCGDRTVAVRKRTVEGAAHHFRPLPEGCLLLLLSTIYNAQTGLKVSIKLRRLHNFYVVSTLTPAKATSTQLL